MGKKIEFDYEGKHYTLEYCRKTVKMMEDAGFKLSDLVDRPMSFVPVLFAGAWRMHHPGQKQELIDEVYAALEDKRDMLEQLTDMFNEPYETLFEEPEDESKKVAWTAV